MHIALTGTTGRVGSRLLPRLLARGDRVRTLVRTEEAAGRMSDLGAEPVVGDLRDTTVHAPLTKDADVVLHVAARFRARSATGELVAADEQEVHSVNVEATRELAHAAAVAGAPGFVLVSTQLVYPGGLGRPAVETDPTDPDAVQGAYPRSKVAIERDLLGRSGGGLALTVVRLAFVYGEGDPHLRESLRWAAGWPGHHRLHMIHHADVAQALVRVLEAPRAGGRVYNAADDAPMTGVELHQLNGVAPPGDHEKGDGKDDEKDEVSPDPWHGIVSTRRIRRELGFWPRFPSAWAAEDAGAL